MPAGSPLNICITRAGCTSKALLTQCWKQPGLFLALVCRRKDSLVALPSHSEAFYSSVVKQPRKIIQTDLVSERPVEWQLFLSWAPLSNGVCLNLFCSTWDIPPEKALFPAPLSCSCRCAARCSRHLCLAVMQSRGSHCLFQCKYFFVEKQKGWKKGGYGNIQDEIRNLRQKRTHQLPQLTHSSARWNQFYRLLPKGKTP